MIPRREVEHFRTLIEKALKEADPDCELAPRLGLRTDRTVSFEIMGSFRRGEEVSSDIDMVVWHPLVLRPGSLHLCLLLM